MSKYTEGLTVAQRKLNIYVPKELNNIINNYCEGPLTNLQKDSFDPYIELSHQESDRFASFADCFFHYSLSWQYSSLVSVLWPFKLSYLGSRTTQKLSVYYE